VSGSGDIKPPVVYRVETDRLLLRCWSPEDAPALRAALDESDRHLRPWIPFMKDEPRSLEQTAGWLRSHRASFDSDQLHRFGVFSRQDGTLLGENMLLPRVGPGGLEVGYWTRENSGGHGYATEASCAMIRIAFDVAGVERVEIHCAPDNAASTAIPAKLDFRHEATLSDRAPDTEGVMHDLMIWTLFAKDYPGSPASKVSICAYNCLGEEVFKD
jgi:RimJ/RimL family protein N-acetyltransferase